MNPPSFASNGSRNRAMKKKPTELSEEVWRAYEQAGELKPTLLELRKSILNVARTCEIAVEETLKWGAPAFVTPSGVGTTLRIEYDSSPAKRYYLRVHCQSSVVDRFRVKSGKRFEYDGTRGLVFSAEQKRPDVDEFVRLALTYHIWKKKSSAAAGK